MTIFDILRYQNPYDQNNVIIFLKVDLDILNPFVKHIRISQNQIHKMLTNDGQHNVD